jgi:uncharacterized protein (TIGR02145 family)
MKIDYINLTFNFFDRRCIMRFFARQGRALLLAAAVIGAVCASNVFAQGAAGTFTDKRDGKTYKTVKIGGKTWMAENLNYKTGNSWCYNNDNSNCNKYGRSYDWNTAKAACPSGWHLPSNAEWDGLGRAVGGVRWVDDREEYASYWVHWKGAGKALKSMSGWDDFKGRSGNGTDNFDFSALPGGGCYFNLEIGCYSAGREGLWWTSSDDEAIRSMSNEYYLVGDSDMLYVRGAPEGVYSVRCVEN